jgi:hypothetical protein
MMQGPFAFPGDVPLTFARVAVLAVCWVALVVANLRGVFVFYKMFDEVNANLPESERFSPAWWYLDKSLAFRRQYLRLFPSAPRFPQIRHVGYVDAVIVATALLAAGAGFVIVVAVGIGASVVTWRLYRDPRQAPSSEPIGNVPAAGEQTSRPLIGDKK